MVPRLSAVPAVVAGLLCLAPPLAAQRTKISVNAVVDAAASYLVDYQKQFAFVLADEQYTQQVVESTVPGPRRRTITGESFLTFATGDHAWISRSGATSPTATCIPT